jgi:hypothetical protein
MFCRRLSRLDIEHSCWDHPLRPGILPEPANGKHDGLVELSASTSTLCRIPRTSLKLTVHTSTVIWKGTTTFAIIRHEAHAFFAIACLRRKTP